MLFFFVENVLDFCSPENSRSKYRVNARMYFQVNKLNVETRVCNFFVLN